MTFDRSPEWDALSGYEKLVEIFEVVKLHLVKTTGVSRAAVDALGEPYVQSLNADPLVFVFDGGTEVSIPQFAMAAVVGLRLRRRAERHDALN